jgi:hypothetical protein
MPLEINNQYDFFKNVNLDDDGNLLVKIGDGSFLSGNASYQVQNPLTLALGLTPNMLGNTVSTVILSSNTVVMYPFVLGMDYLATKIATQVTTFAAGATAYLGVYELDSDFMPLNGAPIISSTGLSVATNG